MPRRNYAIRVGASALAVGAFLALAGCGGGATSSAVAPVNNGGPPPANYTGPATASNAAAVTSAAPSTATPPAANTSPTTSVSAGCTAIERGYAALRAGVPSGDYRLDGTRYLQFYRVLDLISFGPGQDAYALASDSHNLGGAVDMIGNETILNGGWVASLWAQRFDKYLKAVGDDCGTTFTPTSLKILGSAK